MNRSCLFTDGTGEPNPEGINYYNNLIDTLLEKGEFVVITSILNKTLDSKRFVTKQ